MSSLQNQAIKGMMWNAVERFSTQGIQFLLTLIIARILTPGDYGLVAMLTIFLCVAQTFIDSGFYNALIHKQDRTDKDYSTVYWYSLAVSILFYSILFFTAPLVAEFYQQPALVKLFRVLGLFMITSTIGSLQMARFTIMLDFKHIAEAALISTLVGGTVGVVMAYSGYGAWALVFQQLSGNVIWSLTLCLFSSWLPKRMFSMESFRSLFSYGSKLLFSNLLQTIYINMYSLVIGKFFNTVALGLFNRASSLGQFPVQNTMSVIQKVIFTIQCHFQNNVSKFNQVFCIQLRLSSFVLFPLMIGFAALATPVISLVLTDKWLPMVPLLQILCIAYMWCPVMQANVLVLDAKGRTDWHLKSEIIKKIAAVALLCITLPYGVQYVCWGMVAYSVVDMGIIVFFSRRLTSIGYRKQFAILFPTLMLSLAMGGIVLWLTSDMESSALRLLVGIPVGVLFYLGMAFLLKMPEIKMIASFIKERRIVLTDNQTVSV